MDSASGVLDPRDMSSANGARVVAGRYRLEELIGSGGMGEVYRATHLELGLPVAVKLLGSSLRGQPAAIERLRREARALARVKSPHIVQIHDFGVDEGDPFLVTELLVGEPLSSRLDRVGRLSLTETSRLLSQASRGLEAAHDQGIVHRDIKPSNLFLAQTREGEILKVLDFGIAKRADEDAGITSPREVIGTPLYMSPEHAEGSPVDARTDVWSLAAVTYLMLTGSEAYDAPSTAAILMKIVSGRAPVASAACPDLPSEFDAFFSKAFAGHIDARFQTCGELALEFAGLAGLATAPAKTADFFRTSDTLSVVVTKPARALGRYARWLLFSTTAALLVAAVLVFMPRGEERLTATPPNSSELPSAAQKIEPIATTPPLPVTATAALPSASASASTRRPTVARPKSRASATPSTAPPSATKRDPLFGL